MLDVSGERYLRHSRNFDNDLGGTRFEIGAKDLCIHLVLKIKEKVFPMLLIYINFYVQLTEHLK